jgi:uncharacterized FlaG/YvyC family protein
MEPCANQTTNNLRLFLRFINRKILSLNAQLRFKLSKLGNSIVLLIHKTKVGKMIDELRIGESAN